MLAHGVQSGSHRFGRPLQPAQSAQSPEHVGRVHALSASGHEVAALLTRLKKRSKQKMLGIPFYQSAAELREGGEVKAGVGKFEAQSVLPVYAGAGRERGDGW